MDPQNREPLIEELKEQTEAENNTNSEKKEPGRVPVYAERAETRLPETDPDELKALALAYARYLAEHNLTPGDPTFTDSEPQEQPETAEKAQEEPVAAEELHEELVTDEKLHEEAAAVEEVQEELEAAEEQHEEAAVAEEIQEKLVATEELHEEQAAAEIPAVQPISAEEHPAEKHEEPADNTPAESDKPAPAKAVKSDNKRKLFKVVEPDEEEIDKIAGEFEKSGESRGLSALIDLHDRLQGSIDEAANRAAMNFVAALHKITSTYRQSRRYIGAAILFVGILIAVVLAIFDRFTVYEYAYNGKTLGYVKNQEDVTDVLDIAGTMLTENSTGDTEIRFTANQNVTFKQVDARGKSTDDADIAVNKLVYMTDIETEAFGVYDGPNLVAVVKSNEDAENLLLQTKDYLSIPDKGMELVSSDFTNELAIRPINVLLTSIQSNNDAMKLMTEGGMMEIYHIVEEGETIEGLSQTFGVDPVNIFNEDNSALAEEILQGDKICIHEEVEPVSVQMVETGKMKEIIEFETVKEESDEYYKGDTYTKQEGVDGVQIFEGTITKIAGEVTDRDGKTTERVKKKDKIILVGTAERPKTAPTGTYGMPIQTYTLSSNFGYRWGRLHSGIDMAAPTGTPIYASDGGTVQRAGWYAGYGLCVEVNHENGRMTRYGHCSALLVNVGDKVYQGQNIALVGNTGHSFGSHLHFEINLNGSPVDPRPYLGI